MSISIIRTFHVNDEAFQLVLNTADGALYLKDSSNSVRLIFHPDGYVNTPYHVAPIGRIKVVDNAWEYHNALSGGRVLQSAMDANIAASMVDFQVQVSEMYMSFSSIDVASWL